jgi:hypothetical protein
MIHLYIKKCSHCKLLYFGRTEAEDPHKYPGSGIYWKRHLRKHNAVPETLKVRSFKSQSACTKAALAFSKRYDIVNDRNESGKKIWANQVAENGKVEGYEAGTLSKSSRKKMSKIHRGRQIYNDGDRHYQLFEDDPLIVELNLESGWTKSVRLNLKEKLSGRKKSAEECRRISEGRKGVIPSYSEEQISYRIQRVRESCTGKPRSEETKQKLAEAARRQMESGPNPMDSPLARAKVSASKMGAKNPAFGKRWFTDGKSNFLLAPSDPKCKKLKIGMTR